MTPIKLTKTLEVIYPVHLEHELFRACIQAAVGIEQKHADAALAGYAKRLRELANKHISTSEFA